MSISRDVVGRELATITSTIERGRLRFFAEATGQTDPLYSDLEAARSAGFPDLPVPPTFLFGLKLDQPDAFAWLTGLGVDLRFILHGGQRFDYHAMAFAGDELTQTQRISDLSEKRGGALEFLTTVSEVTRAGAPIATLTETIVVRHPELEPAREARA
jgi:acyl dehydratase